VGRRAGGGRVREILIGPGEDPDPEGLMEHLKPLVLAVRVEPEVLSRMGAGR
jgi:hypothetical protein